MADYLQARRELPAGQLLVITGSRAEARRLNGALRGALLQAGLLGATALDVPVGAGTLELRAGEQVLVTANDYRRNLLNGTRGQIRAVDPARRTVQLQLADGRRVELDEGYLRAGRLAHGYALTCHKAQGITVQVAMLWGSGPLCREVGYVAMSRGRQANFCYTTPDALAQDVGGELDRPRHGGVPNPAQRLQLARAGLVARLSRSSRQQLASGLAVRRRPATHAPRPAAGRQVG